MSKVIFFQKGDSFIQVDPNYVMIERFKSDCQYKAARFIVIKRPLAVYMCLPIFQDWSELFCLAYAMQDGSAWSTYNRPDLNAFARENLGGAGNVYGFNREKKTLEFTFREPAANVFEPRLLKLQRPTDLEGREGKELVELLESVFPDFQIICKRES